MACSTCNSTILKRIEDIRKKNPVFRRAELYRDLIFRGGSLFYLAAPREIPEDVKQVRTPYGVMPVLHLELRVCDDGRYTDQADWGGVNKGIYLDDRAYLKLEVHEDIPKALGARPLQYVINAGLVTIRYLGTAEAQWAYEDGEVVDATRDRSAVGVTYEINLPASPLVLTDDREELGGMLKALLALLERRNYSTAKEVIRGELDLLGMLTEG
jgi:hypothetical protein